MPVRNYPLDALRKLPSKEIDQASSVAYKTPCNHIFHKKCIQQWFDKSATFVPTCPMCRKDCHVNYKQDNNYTVNSSYSLVDHAVEMERTSGGAGGGGRIDARR